MDIPRSRVEGLLVSFPKLIHSDEQHTFVETDSVRYVYQSLESLYMVLITTKNSNILEDLETLRLFTKVIPEYCRVMSESEVSKHAFELIFAFDEIIALGYRENVNLAQIRTYTEMDSHEENIAKMVQKVLDMRVHLLPSMSSFPEPRAGGKGVCQAKGQGARHCEGHQGSVVHWVREQYSSKRIGLSIIDVVFQARRGG